VPFSLRRLANVFWVEAAGRRSLGAILGGRFFGVRFGAMEFEKNFANVRRRAGEFLATIV
jgi:hypothetical protein